MTEVTVGVVVRPQLLPGGGEPDAGDTAFVGGEAQATAVARDDAEWRAVFVVLEGDQVAVAVVDLLDDGQLAGDVGEVPPAARARVGDGVAVVFAVQRPLRAAGGESRHPGRRVRVGQEQTVLGDEDGLAGLAVVGRQDALRSGKAGTWRRTPE